MAGIDVRVAVEYGARLVEELRIWMYVARYRRMLRPCSVIFCRQLYFVITAGVLFVLRPSAPEELFGTSENILVRTTCDKGQSRGDRGLRSPSRSCFVKSLPFQMY